MTDNAHALPVLDQGGGKEDGGLSRSLHTDLVHQAGVLAGQAVGGEEGDCLGAGQATEHFSSVIILLVDSQSRLAPVTCLTERTGKLGTLTHHSDVLDLDKIKRIMVRSGKIIIFLQLAGYKSCLCC